MADPAESKNPITQAVRDLGAQIFDVAAQSWKQLKDQPEVSQELLKDPFTQDMKEQAATAELLVLLLHASDRLAQTTFQAALPAEHVQTVRSTFISALVGVSVPAFVRIACPEEDKTEQADTQADVLHLYNTRATQYGLFGLGDTNTTDGHEGLLKLAAIRVAEAVDCSDNETIIRHSMDTILASFQALQDTVPLRKTIAQLLAGA